MDEKIIEIIKGFISLVAVRLPDDVEDALKTIAEDEEGRAAEMYECIFKNIALAKKLNRPLCQDTGMLQYFVKVGTSFPYINDIEKCIIKATEIATAEIPLRPNVIEPFTEFNTGNNIGFGAPYIEWTVIPDSDKLHIDLYLAGGGCSLPGRSKVFMPHEGTNGLKRFVYETIVEFGLNSCPPLMVGIGLGSCAVTGAILSKKALLRSADTPSENPYAAKLEKEIRNNLDSLGIAPFGIGGKKSVLSVNIECAGHHPAAIGAGISIGCWATRRGAIDISADLSFEVTSHKINNLGNL